MYRSLKQQAVFLKQFGARFQTTGSILPSSRFLARAITRYLAQRGNAPIRILECGPGTGAFTNRIVELLRPGDQFDLVELNSEFVQVLRERFANDPAWQPHADISRIHELPLQEFAGDVGYDYVISGLPHVNFPAELVREITESYFRLLRPTGTLSYFEYMYIRPLRKRISLGASRIRMHAVDEILEDCCGRHRVRRDSILLNAPPAWVHHLQLPSAPGGGSR